MPVNVVLNGPVDIINLKFHFQNDKHSGLKMKVVINSWKKITPPSADAICVMKQQ